MSRGKNLLKNTFVISFGTFVPRFASLITLPIITGSLTKAELGTYDLITTLITLFCPISTLQLGSAIFRFLIEYREEKEKTKEVVSSAYLFINVFSVVSLIIFYCGLYKLNFGTRILIVACYYLEIQLYSLQQVARGMAFNRAYSFSSVVQAFTNTVLIFLCISIKGWGLYGALIARIVAIALGLLYIIIRCKLFRYISVSFFDKELLEELLRYSCPMIPNSISLWVLSSSDRLLLTIFMGVEAEAEYSVAYKIPAIFMMVQNTFMYAWQENASLAYRDSDVNDYYSKVFSCILRILAGVLALLVGTAPFLYKILIKGDYTSAFSQMPILFIALFFCAVSSFLGGIYVAQKKTINIGCSMLIASLVNLAIDLALINHIGIYAASISTLASYFLLTIYRMINIQSFQKIKYNVLEFIVICCVLLLFGFLCNSMINIKSIITLLFAIVFSIVINKDNITILFDSFKNKFNNSKDSLGK